MATEFKRVPEEVRNLIDMSDSSIFWINYTHLSSTNSRKGIQQTGKIMAPRIALAHDIVPFSGEPDWRTYLFRAYHVSVTNYDPLGGDHHWRNYLHYGSLIWTPEGSNQVIQFFEEEQKIIQDRPFNYVDFERPEVRSEQLLRLDQCIELEKIRQARYAQMSEEEQQAIKKPKQDIYVFGPELRKLVSRRELFGKSMQQVSHPFAPAEINLKRYLKGMFTSADKDETKQWISEIVRRNVTVGSIDALATWENALKEIPLRLEYVGQQLYWKMLGNLEIRQKAIEQVMERLLVC